MTSSINLIVAALVRQGQAILLVEQQGPWDPEPSWMLPGGRVEANETLLGALARELAEETGLRLIGTPRIALAVDIDRSDGVYDCLPLERYLSGEASAGTVYAADRR